MTTDNTPKNDILNKQKYPHSPVFIPDTISKKTPYETCYSNALCKQYLIDKINSIPRNQLSPLSKKNGIVTWITNYDPPKENQLPPDTINPLKMCVSVIPGVAKACTDAFTGMNNAMGMVQVYDVKKHKSKHHYPQLQVIPEYNEDNLKTVITNYTTNHFLPTIVDQEGDTDHNFGCNSATGLCEYNTAYTSSYFNCLQGCQNSTYSCLDPSTNNCQIGKGQMTKDKCKSICKITPPTPTPPPTPPPPTPTPDPGVNKNIIGLGIAIAIGIIILIAIGIFLKKKSNYNR